MRLPERVCQIRCQNWRQKCQETPLSIMWTFTVTVHDLDGDENMKDRIRNVLEEVRAAGLRNEKRRRAG